MKTLAVLSALAAIAIAAPALEDTRQDHHSSLTPVDFTITQEQDKKSTLSDAPTEKSSEHSEDHALAKTSNKFGSSSVVRTFSGFKKPIIVKKKIGYHVYRDSEEEQAQTDSRESCRKQIKVKLCDDNNSLDKIKSATNDDVNEEILDSDMKQSINMAKEAVESFQRDLRKIEHQSAEANAERNTGLEADEELHKDIETARQALAHIQKRFRNLDSGTESNSSPNMNLKMTKTDEERMALWKEVENKHNGLVQGRNLEDNFKEKVVKGISSKDLKSSLKEEDKKSIAVAEDIDERASTNMKETKDEDEITSVIEDKENKMEIHSDSLKKENTVNERAKSVEQKTHDLGLNEKHAQTDVHSNGVFLLNDNVGEDKEIKLQDEHERSMNRHDEELLSSNNRNAMRSEEPQMLNEESAMDNTHNSANKNGGRDDVGLGSKTSFTERKSPNQEETQNVEKQTSQHIDEQRTIQEKAAAPKKSQQQNLDNEDGSHRSLGTDRDTQALQMTTSKSENHEVQFKNEHDEHEHQNEKVTDHMPLQFRASSNFHKDLLNNMDFVEDSHQMPLNKQLTKSSHMLKNEKPELQERFNVPGIQANSDHLRTMMDLSDNSHLEEMQRPQVKMSSFFNNNEQPNVNVQVNSPQTFEDQTNFEQLMPFKAAEDMNHDETSHKFGVDERMHGKDNMLTDVHDPLKVRWAHENNLNLEKMKAASQLNEETMKMDGSSPHFVVDKSMAGRANFMDQHMHVNNQLNGHHRWAQGKSMNTAAMDSGLTLQNFQLQGNENLQQSFPMRNPASNFEQLQRHDSSLLRNNDRNLMMHEKSNIDPSSFMHMRGAPKMALEYSNPNQWTHNHGAFRSSYGPSMSASYGSGGGSSSGGGGSGAVGIFPNANVGNCAVPILLSCSPSVVSGSLAKANSYSASSYGSNSYSAPSYRSEDMNYIKKTRYSCK